MIHLCDKMPNAALEQRNIDEVSFETDVGNIAYPDLIAPRDLKGLKAIHPGTQTVNGCRGLTDTFDTNRQVRRFHQSRDASITYGVSHTHQQLCDAPIPIFRIPQR